MQFPLFFVSFGPLAKCVAQALQPVAFKGFGKIPCSVWEGCVSKILEDIAVFPLLDVAPERVRSEPRKGRFPRFSSILWPTDAPYGAHYERGEASRPIRNPLGATGWKARATQDTIPK